MRRLILASSSPRRQQLLSEAGIPFIVEAAEIDETPLGGEGAQQYALRLAQEKAVAVARKFPQDLVLGADTIVIVDNDILGKPAGLEDAARMLRRLSGRMHQVFTAVALVVPGKSADTRSCTTEVHFRKLGEKEIQKYVAGGEPMDKAGAYAIQGGGAQWITQLEGDYSNVVGLPLTLAVEMLRACGYLRP